MGESQYTFPVDLNFLIGSITPADRSPISAVTSEPYDSYCFTIGCDGWGRRSVARSSNVTGRTDRRASEKG
jgi:hypothetical protein